MVPFKDRLKEALDAREITAADLSRKSGIDEGTLSNYKKGKYVPKQRKLEAIAVALNVSIPWLMGADVPMNKERNGLHLVPPNVTSETVTFPVIGNIAAGYNEIAIEDWSGDTVEIPISYLKGHKQSEFFVLSVKGNSMYPMYHNGDKVLIFKQSYIDNSGDIGAIIYDNECATLKKIEFANEQIRLVPLNPEYMPKVITGTDVEECHILGIPKMLIREIN